MIDQDVLGHFINVTFMQFVPAIGGTIIAIVLSLLFYLALRDRFLKEESSG